MAITELIGRAVGSVADAAVGIPSYISGARRESTASGTSLGQSQYNFDYTVFPRDIGMDYNGHYCVININVPTRGVKGPTEGLRVNNVAGAFGDFFTPLNQVSKLDVLRYGNYSIPGASGAVLRSPLSIPRNTRRIAESIALFMPTPLVFDGKNVYQEISLSALAGKAIGVGAQLASGTLDALSSAVLGDTIAGRAFGAIARGLGSVASPGFQNAVSVGAKLAQTPINPAIEVVFANTLQRQFAMEWLLAPRNEAESYAVQKIIQTLRFHAAPELNPLTSGFTWIPPADFDITFFNKGAENNNILRINTCVLEQCRVQYDPTGVYSTFRNGHPVAVQLSLAFRELEPTHKARVLAGF